MIRLVVQQVDVALLAGGVEVPPAVTYHTFDVDAPDLERFLKGAGGHVTRSVLGAAVPLEEIQARVAAKLEHPR